MAGIKLIVFDMEGTLFEKAYKDSKGNTSPSAWTLIAEKLGPEAYAEEEATKDKWNEGGYAGYVEWMEDTIRIHQKYNLTKEFFERVMFSVPYHKGVKETFEELNKLGYKTALISGGFKAQADRACRDLKIDHVFAACEYYWAEDGSIEHWNLLPCDYEGKLDFMHLVAKEHGLTPDQCAFVGDGVNDVAFAEAVKYSIAFNGHPKLQKAATVSINQEEKDFTAVLEQIKKWV